ncbi:sulfatase-like hydrolase/transferase [Streptomyces sp. NPDC048473]|uniref:sulfatase-like hydrolase/transferase n=1 Tax=unclassified Streptomyces TaxID=2593676 RepID=UPI00371F40E2
MTELYPSMPAGPSRRSTLRAAGGGSLLLGLGLAGCRSAVSETSSAPKNAGAAPERGGILSVAINSDFTPSLLFSQSGQSFQHRLIYNTLTRYDDRLSPKPELATSWTYAEDGRSITLRLRDDVTFHNGRKFTADDVIFAVRNLQNPVRAAQLRSTAATITEEQQKLYARYMEVYAALVDNIDQNLGRLTETLDALGELDNTIIVFTSDNGGTGEGGAEGTRSYFSRFVHHPALPGDWTPDVDRDPELMGGPRSLVHYPRGWGMASNTPFRLYKGHTYAGGVRVPFVLSWPKGAREGQLTAGLRTQYQYVTDIAPTLLRLAGLDRPAERRGVPLQEPDGVSFTPVLADAEHRSTHPEQYCEMTGNRSYYRDGHKLVTLHRPGLVKELSAAWEEAAWRNGVFPLPDGSGALARRNPAEQRLSRPLTLLPGTPELERYRSSRLIALRSFEIVVVVDEAGEGVLVSHGDQGGGYSLYVEDGRLRFAYNEYGVLHETDAGPLAPGEHVIVLAATAEQGLRWRFTLTVDGEVRATPPSVHQLIGMAPFQGISIGIDRKSPVSWPLYERHRSFRHRGRLRSVTYRPGEPGPDSPEAVAAALKEAAAAFE